jgi:hypothetical protein
VFRGSISPFELEQARIGICFGKLWVKSNGFAEISDGAVNIAFALVGVATVAKGYGVIRVSWMA